MISTPDSNDTRMQQVMFANGKLWGALDSAVTVGGENRAGIAYYVINPSSGKLVLQGLLGVAGADLTYPAIGVTASGRGVMAFTYTGDSHDPECRVRANRREGRRRSVVVRRPGGAGSRGGRRLHELQVPGR